MRVALNAQTGKMLLLAGMTDNPETEAAMLEYLFYRRLLKKIGNGNQKKGKAMLALIASRLDEARKKHPGHNYTLIDGAMALESECKEFKQAMLRETPDRQLSEILDAATVCIRIIGREYTKRLD